MAANTFVQKINNAFTQVGSDIKVIKSNVGNLSNLAGEFTTNNANGDLVKATNYLLEKANTIASSAGATINDNSTSTSTTYSSNKIDSLITSKVAEVVDSAPETFDTLKEVATWIEGNTSAVNAINNKLPYNETKSLDATQLQNVYTTLELGSTNANFLETYTTARDS